MRRSRERSVADEAVVVVLHDLHGAAVRAAAEGEGEREGRWAGNGRAIECDGPAAADRMCQFAVAGRVE